LSVVTSVVHSECYEMKSNFNSSRVDPITHTQCAPDKHPRIIIIRQLESRASALLATHRQRRQQSDKLLDIQASGSQLYNDASISRWLLLLTRLFRLTSSLKFMFCLCFREAGIQNASHDALICDAVRRT